MPKHWFREFITGKKGLLLTEAEKKSVVLRGNLTLVGLTVGISYIFIDHFNGIYGNEAYYVATIIFSIVAFYLNRIGRHKLASLFFVSTINLIVFLFSRSDTYRSGVYIFFVVTSLTAFALFGYKERKWAISFTFLSLLLFIYSYWGPQQTPKRIFTEEFLHINFTTNFIVALITSIAIVYFLIDVNFHSERQILTKNEQLAKANTELDRFVYSASHDLRAPLSSILGLVKVYTLTDNQNEKNQVVGLIEDRVNKLDNFIREILDYSRNSRLQIKKETLKGTAFVEEVIEGLRYTVGFEKIKFDLHATDCILYTDAERLKVILSNLLANSLKYHDVSNSHPLIKISFTQTNKFWSAIVEDNGVGIHPDHHTKIFEMFFRAHENSEGSGLGLYIVKEVVERMGGTVSVRSQPGKGSIFTVTVPND